MPNMYRVKMPDRLRYTIVAALFVMVIGSVLIAVEQKAVHWYTWVPSVAFIIGAVPLLWELPHAKNPAYGWFYNWLASGRQPPRRRYAILALWLVIIMEQVAIAMKRGHMDWRGGLLIALVPLVLFRYLWPLPKSWPLPKTN
jgi:hypothetical protein